MFDFSQKSRLLHFRALYPSGLLPVLLFFLCICSSYKSIAADTKPLTKEDYILDIEDYKNKIIKNHAHPFNYITRQQFLDSVAAFQSRAPQMNIDELKVGFLKLNALLLDPHTNVDLPRDKFLPLMVNMFDDGVILIGTSFQYSSYLGARILEVEQTPIDTLLQKLRCLVGANNQSWIKYSLPRILSVADYLAGMHLISSKDSVPLTLLVDKDTVHFKMATENQYSMEMQYFKSAKPMLRSGNSQNYWYKYIEDKKAIYIQYQSCIEMPDKPMAKFQETVLADIHRLNPERIIIDMRYNSGGRVPLFTPFIKAMARDSICQLKKTAVLIGRRTFSAAIWNTFEMKNQLKATLIGEETGGDLNHPGAVYTFDLKHTKIKVAYSKYDFYLDATVKAGILPDIPVKKLSDDYKNGIDPELEKAFTY